MSTSKLDTLLATAVQTQIDMQSTAKYSEEIQKDVNDLLLLLEGRVSSAGASGNIVGVDRSQLEEYKMNFDTIIRKIQGTSENTKAPPLSQFQFGTQVRLSRVLMCLVTLEKLYADKNNLNKLELICGVGRELEKLESQDIAAIVKLFNDSKAGKDADDFTPIHVTTKFGDLNVPNESHIPNIKNSLAVPLDEDAKTFLFYGPPGTGKTSIAFAIANEFSGGEAYYLNSSNLIMGYVGEGEAKLTKFFDKIRSNPKTKYTIILDEFNLLFEKVTHVKNLLQIIQLQLGGALSLKNNVAFIAITNYLREITPEIQRRFAPLYLIMSPERQDLFRSFYHRLFQPYNKTKFPKDLLETCYNNLHHLSDIDPKNILDPELDQFFYTEGTLNAAYRIAAKNAFIENQASLVLNLNGTKAIVIGVPPGQTFLGAEEVGQNDEDFEFKIVIIKWKHVKLGLKQCGRITIAESKLYDKDNVTVPI